MTLRVQLPPEGAGYDFVHNGVVVAHFFYTYHPTIPCEVFDANFKHYSRRCYSQDEAMDIVRGWFA